MDRKNQLEYCKVCKHRKKDFHKGIVCGLTNERADFIETCSHYVNDDTVEVRKIEDNSKQTVESVLFSFLKGLLNRNSRTNTEGDLKTKRKIKLKVFEMIFISFFIFNIILQLFQNFSGRSMLLVFSALLLSLWYLIFSYWAFCKKKKRRSVINVFAGIAFSTSIITFPFLIWLAYGSATKVLTAFNILFFICLSLYLFKHKNKILLKKHKLVWFRSLIILVIVGFFAYAPITFNPYRYLIIKLNNGNETLVSNIQMHAYGEEYLEAMENGDCDQAIASAEKSFIEGCLWNNVDLEYRNGEPDIEQSLINLLHYSERKQMRKGFNSMSGVFTNLYEAYTCKGSQYIDNDDYSMAFKYLKMADLALSAYVQDTEYWKESKSDVLNNLALCLMELGDLELSDSLYYEALTLNIDASGELDYRNNVIYSNYAQLQEELNNLEDAIILYNMCLDVLIPEYQKFKSVDDLDEIRNVYHDLVRLNMVTDNLPQARELIRECIVLSDFETAKHYTSYLMSGLCYYKMNEYYLAEKEFVIAKQGYERILEPSNQNIAENLYALAISRVALAKYDLARNDLDEGSIITINNHGENSSWYAKFILANANFSEIMGDFRKAECQYLEAEKVYNVNFGENNKHVAKLLPKLANVQVTLGKYKKAEFNLERAINIGEIHFDTYSFGYMTILNSAADAYYGLGKLDEATQLYNRILSVNEDFGYSNSASTAMALNGLALVYLDENKINLADSLLNLSLEIHVQIFTEDHPYTAIVYANMANLRLDQNRIEEAIELTDKAMEINEQYFDQSHYNFAELYVVYANAFVEKRDFSKAVLYFNKAQQIYIANFGKNHYKVLQTKELLEYYE